MALNDSTVTHRQWSPQNIASKVTKPPGAPKSMQTNEKWILGTHRTNHELNNWER